MTCRTMLIFPALLVGTFWTTVAAIFGATGNVLILTFFGLTILTKLGLDRNYTHSNGDA